tara:strand:+ start:89 stop:1528 length:1440 start_codon:yes stop_codon:yes gene_type:complete
MLAMILVPVTDTTEARYAEIARKMLETGDWITPQFEYGVPFWGKPPLHTWLSAAGMGAFGVNEFAARLPIFALACALLALVYYWARAEKGNGFALVGTTILASSGMFFIASGVVMTDLAMIAGTTLSMVGFWRTVNQRPHQALWGYLFFVGLAIGLLTKGPLAVLLAGVPIGLWVILGNRWRDTWQRIPWVTGTVLMLVLTAPWYIAAELKTPGFLRYFIIGEHFERFTVPGWKGDLYGSGHREPKGMIWLFGLLAFLPWTFGFLRPVMRLRQVAERFRNDGSGWGSYLLLWTLSPFLIFTAAGNIIIPYALPALPAAAFLLVQSWTDAHDQGAAITKRSALIFKSLSVGVIVVMTVFSAVYAAAPGLISKKSQNLLVAEATSQAPYNVGELIYWKKRYYSAEFYTQGTSKRINTLDALSAYLSDNRRDFLVIRPAALKALSDEMRDRFALIGPFGKDLLLLEKPIEPSLTSPAKGPDT